MTAKAAAGIAATGRPICEGRSQCLGAILILLCEKLGVALTNRDALEGALEDALSAEDEALLADFVKRHGGQYPVHAETVRSLPAEDANLLGPPDKAAKLLTAPPDNSTTQMVQSKEKPDE